MLWRKKLFMFAVKSDLHWHEFFFFLIINCLLWSQCIYDLWMGGALMSWCECRDQKTALRSLFSLATFTCTQGIELKSSSLCVEFYVHWVICASLWYYFFFVSFVGEHLDVFLQKHWLEELGKIGSYSALRSPNLRISQGQNICGSSLCIKKNLDLLPVIKSLQAVYQSLKPTGTDLTEELPINVNRTDMTRNCNSLPLLSVNSR